MGPTGPAGSLSGSTALSSFQVVAASLAVVGNTGSVQRLGLSCPAGKVAIGGGLSNTQGAIRGFVPNPPGVSGGWVVTFPSAFLVGSYSSATAGGDPASWNFEILFPLDHPAAVTIDMSVTCVKIN